MDKQDTEEVWKIVENFVDDAILRGGFKHKGKRYSITELS